MRRFILTLFILAGPQTVSVHAQRSSRSDFPSLDQSLPAAGPVYVTQNLGRDRRWQWNASKSSGDGTRTLEGAVIGGIVLAAAGAALAYTFCQGGDSGSDEPCTGKALRSSVVTIPVGAIIGAGIGSTIDRRSKDDQDQRPDQ